MLGFELCGGGEDKVFFKDLNLQSSFVFSDILQLSSLFA
jgi:hypothetical protein